MPFDSNGVFTLPAAATSAFAGKTIASADWNDIFQDIIDSMTQLGKGQIVRSPRIISGAGDITVAVDDLIILIQASVPNINLPASATKTSPVTIVGSAAGIFGTNNSLIVPNGVQTIDGLANVTLSNDYQAITLLPLAAGNWRIVY